ncbi:MAG: glycosyltransferase family 2 protein [Phycisphaerales bacterium]|nr:glycosyltransferase family 2 protein [Phycisphaerales bacterium]
MIFASILVAIGLMYWIIQLALMVRTMQVVPRISIARRASKSDDALVSVIVPARDEERDLEAALRSRLTDPDPHLQFIFVDDRSTDATAAIQSAIAASDARAEVLQIEELPEDWLGKVHAMQHGLQHARGEWILLSDADVHVAPGMVRTAVDFAEERGLSHLAAIPSIQTPSLGLRLCLSPMLRLLIIAVRLWSVHVRGSTAVMGVGAFNLVRRDMLESAGGLNALRMEVIDDIGLGAIIKSAGGDSSVIAGCDGLRIAWYDTFGEFLVGMERGSARLPQRLPRFLIALGCILLALCDLGPFLLLASGAFWPVLGVIGLIASLVVISLSVAMARHFGLSLAASLFVPVGQILGACAAVRSIFVGGRDGTITWRGTDYDIDALRDGARFQFHDRSEQDTYQHHD